MRVIAIKSPKSETEKRLIREMHRLRARIFRGRLEWNVRCTSGLEFDRFDELEPTYILALDPSDAVIGSARLLPAMTETMLQEVFPQLLATDHLQTHHRMIESSRFCVDTENPAGRGQGGLHRATHAMFAGIVEWSILNGYREIVTATDLRLERILRRAGWPLSRLGPCAKINETQSVAGILPADWLSFDRLRPSAYSSDFTPVQQEAA
jgi:acyl homoserine lactone synthase